MFEDELVPLLEDAGTIWDFRLMMDPLSGQNRGYGFATFVEKDMAVESVKQVSGNNALHVLFFDLVVLLPIA